MVKTQMHWQFFLVKMGSAKANGDNLKLVWAEFSTLSWAVSMMCMHLSKWMHAHIYS
jgi:hypothetical protein